MYYALILKETAKGSARSIAGFDLFANLSDCRELLPHFGGHPMAAGMTLHMNDVDELRRRLNEQADAILTEEDFIQLQQLMFCKVEDVTLAAIEDMQKLAPFGVGNPKPRIAVKDAELESIRAIGSDGSHLKWLFVMDKQHWIQLDSVSVHMRKKSLQLQKYL